MNLLATLLLWAVCATEGRRYDMAVIPSTSIDLSTEIGQVLNDAGGSVTVNEPLTYFTSSANINMYSRHKPIRRSDLFYESADTITKNQWWAGVDGDYGIVTNGAKLSDMGSGSYWYGLFQGIAWGLKLPRGYETYFEPYRLGDFAGYTTSTEWTESGMSGSPISVAMGDSTQFYLTGSYSVSFTLANPQSDLLGFSEIMGFGTTYTNMYIGVMLMIPSTTTEADDYGYIYRVITFPMSEVENTGDAYENDYGRIERIDQRIVSLNINLLESELSSYVGKKISIRPCVSTGQVAWLTADDSSITVYDVSPTMASIVQKNFTLLDKDDEPGYVRPTATITATVTRSGNTFTVSNLKATIKRGTGDTTATAYQILITSVSVQIDRYESEAGSWIYYTSQMGYLSWSDASQYVTLSSTSGSTTTWTCPSGVTAVASGSLTARAQISVGFTVRYNNDTFSGTYVSSQM